MVKKLTRRFYTGDTLDIAKKLLGKFLVVKKNGRICVGKIVETEAYLGPDDRAAHSFKGKRTPRTEVEYNVGGYVYIYMVYGMYWQFNIVTSEKDKPECVLIRAVEPIGKFPISNSQFPKSNLKNLANGPGKLCNWLGLDKSFYGEDMTKSKKIWLEDRGVRVAKKDIVAAKRVNIDYAKQWKHKPWRFYIKGNGLVSKK
jgi:DNA-3-methyladenine glycosylase